MDESKMARFRCLVVSFSFSLSITLLVDVSKKKDLLKLWAVLFRTLPREIRREEIQKSIRSKRSVGKFELQYFCRFSNIY